MFSYKEGGSKANRINGVVVGIVTNNNDDEKHLGRVKIFFPWLSQKNETDWVRICSFMAGRERGGFFLPEVGDEVLVAFEHGDINTPFVLGSLWSKGDKPPETNANGKNNIRKIKSRSGHEIIFDDSQGLESLSIRTKSGHNILLDDTPGSEKITIKDKTENNYIEINSSQKSISISSQMDLSIKANSIEIDASEIMKITSGGSMTINGSMIMPPAATVGDQTSHGSPLSLGPGSFNVLINGKQAWRALSDFHMCPLSDHTAHIGGVVSIGSATVMINNLPAVRMGDVIIEAGPPDPIVSGSSNVLIG